MLKVKVFTDTQNTKLFLFHLVIAKFATANFAIFLIQQQPFHLSCLKYLGDCHALRCKARNDVFLFQAAKGSV